MANQDIYKMKRSHHQALGAATPKSLIIIVQDNWSTGSKSLQQNKSINMAQSQIDQAMHVKPTYAYVDLFLIEDYKFQLLGLSKSESIAYPAIHGLIK